MAGESIDPDADQLIGGDAWVLDAEFAQCCLLEGRALCDDLHGEVLDAGRLLGDHHFGGVRVDGLHTVITRC